MAKEVRHLKTYKENLSMFRMMGKGNLIVSARDFLVLQHRTLDSGTGRLESVLGSVEDPLCPPDSNYVRGEMKLLGIRVTPREDGRSDVMIISLANPKGSIPDMFKSKAAKKQAERIKTMLAVFNKRFNN
eukprot:TRINITY_DN4843_c0_g4_i1.p2 TRINITY_DN4843_c0_g4~~TRINITY_DN4843_c0_g4_i1.p2  ORF type:complete len:130 (+),score=32.31 TRINITY_DN4843_c0_g4_i1:430-819(+)